jgi:hypothetical protein
MKKMFFATALVLVSSVSFATQPNRQFTPGALCTPSNPDFTGYRYAAHVAYCKRNVSHQEKLQVAQAYGVPESEWGNYEFDHLIPLNAGGSSQPENLWPQPLAEAHEKDKVEQQTFDGLNNGSLTQDQAVKMIWDWIAQH